MKTKQSMPFEEIIGLLWESYEIFKCTVWVKCRVLNVKAGGACLKCYKQ